MGRAGFDWQFGLGVQHELLPRVSMDGDVQPPLVRQLPAVRTTSTSGCNLDAACIDRRRAGCATRTTTTTASGAGRFAPAGRRRLRDCRLDGHQAGVGRGGQRSTPSRYDDLRPLRHGIHTNFTMRASGGLRWSVGTSTGRQVTGHLRRPASTIRQSRVRSRPFTDCPDGRAVPADLRGTFDLHDSEGRRAGQRHLPAPAGHVDPCGLHGELAPPWCFPRHVGTGLHGGPGQTFPVVHDQDGQPDPPTSTTMATTTSTSRSRRSSGSGLRGNVGMDIYNAAEQTTSRSYNFTYSRTPRPATRG